MAHILDEHCRIPGVSIVGDYQCTLNQTDITTNKNKFYIMQVLYDGTTYYVFVRYGRIGEVGKVVINEYKELADASNYFCHQFNSKTGNRYGNAFTKKTGKYFLAQTEAPTDITTSPLPDQSTSQPPDQSTTSQQSTPQPTLDSRISYFVELISNITMLNNTLKQMNIDSKKMPLGKISTVQLDKAAEVLKQLKQSLATLSQDDITKLSSEYYTYVPYCCGRRKPPIINTEAMIDCCSDIIDNLKNIHVTYSITQKNDNKLCDTYKNLDATLTGMDKNSIMFKEIEQYVENTHCPTHDCKLEIVDVYEIHRNSENKVFTTTPTLLFHGSPISNWCSIIKNGLLLDPSKLGVKITGKMFGYGIYFANAITKSYNYCGSYQSCQTNTAVLTLCEVELGNMHELIDSDYNLTQSTLDRYGKNSTWGKGSYSPESCKKVENVLIPNGKLKHNPGHHYLQYDEFVIYNSDRYRMKYILVVKNVK